MTEAWDSEEKLSALRDAARGKLGQIFCNDSETLKRFLRARKGKEDKALKMLLEHQEWRKTETPWWPLKALDITTIATDLSSLKAYTHGADKEGCPLTFVRAALHDKNEDRAQLKRLMSFLNDEGVARIEQYTLAHPDKPKPQGMVIIVDFTGFGYSHGFDTNAGMLIIQTLSNHYPERLKKIVMTNTPFVFNAFWAVVKVFMDERTASKVLFCKQAEIPEKLDVDKSNLPTFLGGTDSFVFKGAEDVLTWESITKGPMAHRAVEELEKPWELK